MGENFLSINRLKIEDTSGLSSSFLLEKEFLLINYIHTVEINSIKNYWYLLQYVYKKQGFNTCKGLGFVYLIIC